MGKSYPSGKIRNIKPKYCLKKLELNTINYLLKQIYFVDFFNFIEFFCIYILSKYNCVNLYGDNCLVIKKFLIIILLITIIEFSFFISNLKDIYCADRFLNLTWK